tara:strand:+ start:403 stop:1533 length:1131 start_codon:yes stop_codon:yes gene_type:complete
LSRAEQNRLDCLRLIRSDNVGPATFFRLLEYYGDAASALSALPELAKRGGRKRPLKACDPKRAEQELEGLNAIGGQLAIYTDPQYPQHLRALPDAPPVLSLLGETALLNNQGIGIVGARNASAGGMKMAARFAADIGRAGHPVVSGLARGIDTAAHHASLETGTIAVVAGGIDVVYPKENQKLYEQVAARGLIVAESPLGTPPDRRHFPKRNRIIAGLTSGVLVVEAALKSGSLITANMALDYGRDVYAIPGSPMDPRSGGTNSLIKQQSAMMVTTPQDILDDIKTPRHGLFEVTYNHEFSQPPGDTPRVPDPFRAEDTSPLHVVLPDLLSYSPIHADELIRRAGHPAAQVLAALMEMELAGRIERHPGNKISLLD